MAFDCWRDGERIYGVQPMLAVWGGFAMDASFFGENASPKVEELVDVLLAHEGEEILTRYFSSDLLLEYFLQGSETLWGMLDWEKCECDFRGELFRGMLRAAKRYGEKGERDAAELLIYRRCSGFYWFDTPERLEEFEDKKLTALDFFFDDGNHPRLSSNFVMAINAAAPNKEGAWEFLSFLLGDKVQESIGYIENYPARRESLRALAEKEMEAGALLIEVNPDTGRTSKKIKGIRPSEEEFYRKKGLGTEEIAELYRLTPKLLGEIESTLETARPLSVRVEPVVKIILEEARDYFSGLKDEQEVIGVMENRVRLYLQEHR